MKFFTKYILYSLFIFLLCVCASSVYAETEIIGEEIVVDTIWTKDNSPYVLHNDLMIDSGVNLIIEPGTIIKADYAVGIYVQGKLVVSGTTDEKVYFTSLYDDSVGDDTDLDDGLITPYNTDWAGIYSIDNGNIELNNTVILYAENGLYLDTSKGQINNVEINNCQDGISLLNNSVLDINNSTIYNISGDGLGVYYGSTLNLENLDIKDITGQALYMFNNSTANIKNSNIDKSNGIIFYNGGGLNILNSTLQNNFDTAIEAHNSDWSGYGTTTLKILSSTISYGNYIGLQIYGNKIEANVEKTKISNFASDGIQTYSYPLIKITNSEISYNKNGIVSWGSNVEIKNSIISDNVNYGISNNHAVTGAPEIIAINNWWGDKSGPFNADTNASGTANQISWNVASQPWLRWDPRVTRKTPVIIVPGVMGTELKDDTQLLWLNLEKMLTDIGDDFLDSLSFSEDLESKNSVDILNIITKKEISNLSLFNYSDKLINEFKKAGYIVDTSSEATLFTFPYDWRYGVTGLNTDGKISADLLKEKIQEVLDQTGSEKVDIVAHSTGGLIVKKYIVNNPETHHINKAVFVGVPNTGAPKAVKALIQGDSADIPWLSSTEMKKLSRNFPVAYDLLPSQKYYDMKGSYIKIMNEKFMEDTTIQDLKYSDVDSYLIDNYSLNSQALTNAKNLHTKNFDDLDMRNAGVDLYSVNGCKTGTLGKVVEVQHIGYGGRKSIYYNKPEIVPGDGTVPLESSTNLPIDQDHKYYALKASHGKMMSQDGIKDVITNIISGSQIDINDKLITQDISKCKLNGKAISVFSPVDLDVVDQDGNHSGVTPEGDTVNDIPNADIEVWDDHKFIYLPTDDGQIYTVNMKGTGRGTYTIKSDVIIDGQTRKTDTFTDLPVTDELTGTIDISTDVTTLSVKATPESQVEIIKPDSYMAQSPHIQQMGGAGSSLFIKDTATRPVSIPMVKESTSTTRNMDVVNRNPVNELVIKNNNIPKTKLVKNTNNLKDKQVATVATVNIPNNVFNYFVDFIKKIIFFWRK